MLETNLSRLTGFDCTIKYQSCEYKSMFLFSLLQISWSEVYLVKETLQKMCTFQINILMTKLLILCHWFFIKFCENFRNLLQFIENFEIFNTLPKWIFPCYVILYYLCMDVSEGDKQMKPSRKKHLTERKNLGEKLPWKTIFCTREALSIESL